MNQDIQLISEAYDSININPAELEVGIQVEMEHTDDPDTARKIAIDHLREIPDYYTRLTQMEKSAGIE